MAVFDDTAGSASVFSTEPLSCSACEATIARVRAEGRPITCRCGDEYRPARSPETLTPTTAPPTAPGRPRGRPAPRRGAVWVAPVEAPEKPPAPLARQGHAAARAAAEDPELGRVRRLLFELRPDAPDPLQPPPPEAVEPSRPFVRTEGRPVWDRLPRGLCSSTPSQPTEDSRREVLTRIAATAPDARAVLTWLRDRASLGQGLRGLYVDVGETFAGEDQRRAWESLTARRIGAPAFGRELVLGAERAWQGA